MGTKDSYTVQVLMASYNGGRYIAEQITSVLGQDHANLVLTIRDDGSSDDTLEIIRRFEREFPGKVVLADPGGRPTGSASTNFGWLLEHVRGDYYMLCDQDDVWFKDKVSRSLEALQVLEGAWGKQTPLLVFSDLEVTDADLRPVSRSFWERRGLNPETAHSYRQLLANNVITGCTTLFNESARAISSPIPKRRFLHDQWIGFHVAYHGHIACLADPTVYYRQHGNNQMGANRLSPDYFFRKISFFPRLLSDWLWLKAKKSIPVPLAQVIWLKLSFNVKRLFSSFNKRI